MSSHSPGFTEAAIRKSVSQPHTNYHSVPLIQVMSDNHRESRRETRTAEETMAG